MELKLPFGLKDGKFVEVSEVERGLNCRCTCPACGHKLIARKGRKTVHHFAHYKGQECAHAYETTLHLAAKEILERTQSFMLPEVKSRFGLGTMAMTSLSPSTIIKIDRIYLEKKLDAIIPDIILESNGRKLLVEIAVTHFIDDPKLKKIKAMGVSTIEIDLSGFDRAVSLVELEKILIESVEHKSWIFNAKVSAIGRRLESMAKKMPIIMRGWARHVDYCPIQARVWNGKPYANVTDDCSGCPYSFNPEEFLEDEEFTLNIVNCVGHQKSQVDELLKNLSRNVSS